MRLKDYYNTLQLPLTASQQEIKKAYRQLAMKFHPDKNTGNEIAEAHFREIQEAYHVLSDPARRSVYNQQRWYRQSIRRQPAEEALTPEMILVKCRKLNRYVASLDASRINEEPLFTYIMHVLAADAVHVLLLERNHDINKQVITEILQAAKSLSYQHACTAADQLMRLAGSDEEENAAIRSYIKERKIDGYWQQYQFIIILLVTLLICWLIFVVSS